jgi:flagellar hook-length control protein FliK
VPSLAPSAGAPPPTTTPDLAAAMAAAAIGTGNAGHAAPVVDAVATPPGLIVDLLPTAPADAAYAGTASEEPTTGVRTQILQQVLMRGVGKAGASRLTIQLEPEHLGRVTVELRSDGNRLTVVFDAESSVAREALREGGKELVDSLRERGGGRWSQVEVKLAERENDQRQHETDKRREDARQQRQQGGTDGRNGRSNRRRWGG